MQCSTVKGSSVQFSAVQFSAVQCKVVQWRLRLKSLKHSSSVEVSAFLVFKQLSEQSSSLFLFTIIDKILQTMLVVTAAVQHFRTWWLNLLWVNAEEWLFQLLHLSFQIDCFELQDVPRETVKSEQKCADFEIDLKDLYISDWLSIGMQIKDLACSDKCLIDRKWPLH